MGVSYRAAIFVGLPRSEIYDADKEELIEDDTLEVCPTYYDGGNEDWAICGFELIRTNSYQSLEFVFDQDECDILKK